MKSVMVHNFSQVPKVEIPRSVFDRSHGYKTTFAASYLVPVFVDEALPGDTMTLKAHLMARLATPLVPFMDNLFLDTFWFAVPNRLVWEHWKNFCGERATPDDTTEYLIPTIDSPAGGFSEGTIYDYMGLPLGLAGSNTIEISALPLRAYNLIYNEWFRDQNICDPVAVEIGDSGDVAADYELLKRGKRHDYFTSALPWPQKGDAVDLPLGTSAPVMGNGKTLGLTDNDGNDFGLFVQPTDFNMVADESLFNVNVGTGYGGNYPETTGVGIGVIANANSGLYANLAGATAATINSLREAFQLQRMLERDARGGTRYTEIIRSHFGVISPDARMQRPEYLGGSSSQIVINPVQQTSVTPPTGTGNATPMGSLAAYGVVHDSRGGFSKSFTEHCIIIGLVNVRGDISYQQGLDRMWSRQTRYDFYWPALAHLGEQEILQKEIFADGSASDETVWGYQERYAEYRYKPSKITGALRSTSAASLDIWHLSEEFASAPSLTDPDFIEDQTPIDRVIAVPTAPHFIFDSYFEYKCARPMPVFAVPGLIDHF